MAAAFTLYKFKNMIILVIGIMFALAILSQVPSIKDIQFMTGKTVANEVDDTGQLNNAIGTAEDINSLNPKAVVEGKAGNWFFRLLNDNPGGFILIAVIIGGILFLLGVRLKHVRQYRRGLF
jgi:hypothetical protein